MSREPSMEEILSSIRRVIARDEAARNSALEARFGDAAADATPGLDSPSDGTAAEPDDDVLDLTDREDTRLMAAPDADTDAVELPLVSADSAVAARQAIDQLTSAMTHGGAEPAAVAGAASGVTVEALAEAALRPMLKAWLDTNLPPLVERLVAREIARITGGKI